MQARRKPALPSALLAALPVAFAAVCLPVCHPRIAAADPPPAVDRPAPRESSPAAEPAEPNGPPDFGGPPPFGRGDFGPGGPGDFGPGEFEPGGPGGFGGFGRFGPGGPRSETVKLVDRFDKDGDHHLNTAERKAARESLQNQRGPGRSPRGPGFRGPNRNATPPQPGRKMTPADAKSFPDAPLYAPHVLRTLFLEFENPDWEKELEDFNNTDVDVPARLTVDGLVYPDVGVHFRGMSSYMMVASGQKRSLNLSLDFAHKDQTLRGYRTLNLLNSHEDPSFLRTVLALQITREYIPAPKANFVHLVINGESWGVYVNAQQFNKDFVRDCFKTAKGARWKVPGSPGGRGSLAYLGDNIEAYRRIYTIKSKDETRAWTDLIRLCKTLSETPPDQLERALDPILDIDGALRFLALEIVFANGDGYWTRSSDYNLYQDATGRFHLVPHDENEAFSPGGGPGGPGGPGGFGPGMILASQMVAQGDTNQDQRLSKPELAALADAWFDKLDSGKAGTLDQDHFLDNFSALLPPPPGFGPPDNALPGENPGPRGPRGGFGPAPFLGSALFSAFDANTNGVLTRAELTDTFARWFEKWNVDMEPALDEPKLARGLAAVLPQPGFRGRGGRFGGPGRRGFGPGGQDGPGGPGGPRGRGGFGPGQGGAKLDPLFAANDSSKTLIAKLLAVPSLRARYLAYVRDIADKWLDWTRLGSIASEYHTLIAAEVKLDTRKLDDYAAFQTSLDAAEPAATARGPGRNLSLRAFADQRRAFLLGYAEKPAASPAPPGGKP